MILYTVLPIEIIMDGFEEEKRNFREITYQGIKMIVEQIEPWQVRIVQIISTDPAVFLNPSFQPGQIINFQPVFGNNYL